MSRPFLADLGAFFPATPQKTGLCVAPLSLRPRRYASWLLSTPPIPIKRRHAEEWQTVLLLDSADPIEEQHRLWVSAGDSRSVDDDWLANENWRGIGIADMAVAINEKRPHRASGDLAIHVLEVMTRILESGETGRRLDISPATGEPNGKRG
jgi:hypothetical protein